MDLPSLHAPVNIAPQAFAMGVAIAASNSFLYPIGHQALGLVYSPGGYHFFVYSKVGLPLRLLILLFLVTFLPILWSLRGTWADHKAAQTNPKAKTAPP